MSADRNEEREPPRRGTQDQAASRAGPLFGAPQDLPWHRRPAGVPAAAIAAAIGAALALGGGWLLDEVAPSLGWARATAPNAVLWASARAHAWMLLPVFALWVVAVTLGLSVVWPFAVAGAVAVVLELTFRESLPWFFWLLVVGVLVTPVYLWFVIPRRILRLGDGSRGSAGGGSPTRSREKSGLCQIVWSGPKAAITVASTAELEAVLRGIDRRARSVGRAELVQIESSRTRNLLTIGVGAAASVLSYVDASNMPPYWVSTSGSEGGPTLEFDMDGHASEFDARAGIGFETALSACLAFAASGELPDNVSWEEV